MSFAKQKPWRKREALGQVNFQGYYIILANGFHKTVRILRVHNRHVPANAFRPDGKCPGNVRSAFQPGWQIHFEEQSFVSIPMFVVPSLWDISELVNTPFSQYTGGLVLNHSSTAVPTPEVLRTTARRLTTVLIPLIGCSAEKNANLGHPTKRSGSQMFVLSTSRENSTLRTIVPSQSRVKFKIALNG